MQFLSSLDYRSVAAQFNAATDCVAAVNDDSFAYVISGSAAFSSLPVGADNAVGVIRLSLGILATNRGSICSPNFGILLLNKTSYFCSIIRLPILSDLVNAFTLREGFIDSNSTESTDGAFFRYTNTINGGKFERVTRSNNIETAADSGITVAANTFYKLEIFVNATGTAIEFRINNVPVGTNTTNIPNTAGRETGYGVYAQRSLGTAAINALDTDFIAVQQIFTR